MDESPSTVCTIEEEKLDIRPNDHLYTSNLYTDNFISLPPPPPVFGNRQNSIQSNNSKDNEIYSIFSNPNTSYNSINESVESFDQIYHHDYDINQSLDSIPDSLIDNTTIGSNLNITSNTTQSSHLYQVNQNFDSHNQNHNQNQNFLHGTASESNFQFFNSYDNVPDNLDFYHPDASPTTNSISHSPSFTGSHIDYNLSFHNNPAGNHPEVNNRFGVHKFHSEMNLSVNTKISSYNRYGSLSSLSNPSSAISASAIPPNSASSSIPTSASTSTPIKLENGNYLQLATFRHNPQTYLPASHHQNHSPAHMANNLTNQHQHTISHPSNPYVSPRRKPHSDHDDSNTPTTTTTNSISNPNSRSNSISNSPLNSSITSMNSFNIPTMQNIPNLQNQAMAEKAKKHTRRRLLPRSKNGCWICRIKHLKCDEVRPTCSSCEKFGIHCDYSPEKPLYVSDKNLRTEKLLEITSIRKSNQRLKSKVSKKRLKDTNS